jgi:predicted permease
LLPQLPQAPSGVLGGRVVLFALAASVVTGLAFGLIPAFRAGRTDIRTVLGDGRQGAHAERFGGLTLRVLVVAEVALAFVLLTGATLLIQSVVRLTAISPGFNTQRLLTFKLALPDAKYRTDDARSAFAREALAAVARVPGVTAVAGSNALPLAGNNWSGSFTLEGYSPATMSDMPWGDIRIVNADYFSTMQIPVREGRTFSASDVAGAEHVAVVDELFAKRFGEGRSVIGRRISYGRGPTDWWTIVGVVGNTMQQALDAKPRLHVYRALEQYGQPQLEVAVRTGDDPYRLVAPLRAAIAAIDRGVPVADIRTMDDLVTASLGQRRVAMLMLAALAAVALALAALGVYGVISYIVSLRLRELGVRMALGANGAAILGNVISRGMSLAAVGVVVGAVISLLVSRVLATQLYAVKATDPVALVVAAAALSATAFVATSIPAWRATRLDVSAVLRDGS